MTFLLLCLFWGLICGAVCVAIGQSKNYPTTESFLWGFLLGLIGVIVMVCRKPALPPAPPGMWVAKCWQCNAVQNVPHTQTEYSCYRCRAVQWIGTH
jgi:drug/metabolite transporter (DMT)-like permease